MSDDYKPMAVDDCECGWVDDTGLYKVFTYVGPANIYARYMRGEVLTTTDAVTDESSEWVIRHLVITHRRPAPRLPRRIANRKATDD